MYRNIFLITLIASADWAFLRTLFIGPGPQGTVKCLKFRMLTTKFIVSGISLTKLKLQKEYDYFSPEKKTKFEHL